MPNVCLDCCRHQSRKKTHNESKSLASGNIYFSSKTDSKFYKLIIYIISMVINAIKKIKAGMGGSMFGGNSGDQVFKEGLPRQVTLDEGLLGGEGVSTVGTKEECESPGSGSYLARFGHLCP